MRGEVGLNRDCRVSASRSPSVRLAFGVNAVAGVEVGEVKIWGKMGKKGKFLGLDAED